jgi:hypothetical protein
MSGPEDEPRGGAAPSGWGSDEKSVPMVFVAAPSSGPSAEARVARATRSLLLIVTMLFVMAGAVTSAAVMYFRIYDRENGLEVRLDRERNISAKISGYAQYKQGLEDDFNLMNGAGHLTPEEPRSVPALRQNIDTLRAENERLRQQIQPAPAR